MLRVYEEQLEEKVKRLMSVKAEEPKLEDITNVQNFSKFLGHVVNGDDIYVDPIKMETVKNWEAPKSPTKFRTFLGLAGVITETEEPQSLPITSTPIPLPDYTSATPHSDEESEPMEASETRIASPHSTTSPSSSTSPLSPDHLLTQTSPTLAPSRAFFYRSTARMAMRTQPTLSPGISARKRYQGTFEPIEDTKAVLVEDTAVDEPLGLGYGAARRRALELAEGRSYSTYEVG
ncbi:hypothetical protein Tco_0594222 [Tanacetum coccineum]